MARNRVYCKDYKVGDDDRGDDDDDESLDNIEGFVDTGRKGSANYSKAIEST